MSHRPLAPLAVVGPTASGKSSLALELARRSCGAELISVDSMQVYRGMDIGTATATSAEQHEIPHHLIDVLDPDEESSVGWFQTQARRVRGSIDAVQGHSIYVGGTGLYHRAVVDDLDIPGQFPDVLADLDSEPDTKSLHRRLAVLDPIAASRMEPGNRRRVMRALEVSIGSGRSFSSYGAGLDKYPLNGVLSVGLDVERPKLTQNINDRFDRQMEEGFLGEVERLRDRPRGWSRTARQALGYRELLDVLDGRRDLVDAVSDSKQRTCRFAVRQFRWFRRDPRIVWFDAGDPNLVDRVHQLWSETSAAAL